MTRRMQCVLGAFVASVLGGMVSPSLALAQADQELVGQAALAGSSGAGGGWSPAADSTSTSTGSSPVSARSSTPRSAADTDSARSRFVRYGPRFCR